MAETVRVGVIDSGVNSAHPHIGKVAGGISVAIDGGLHEGFMDRLGHGTAVMAAIQEKAPDADYFAIRIFESSLKTSADALQGALDWCLTNRMDVINLSLGTVNDSYAEMFTAAVARASEQGIVLVAASEANGRPCYPGCLPGVFAVEADPECPRDRCRLIERDGRILIQASGYPRPVPGVPPEHNLQGISFAVANASGLVVRARDRAGRDVHRIIDALKIL
jgi:subtilisin family serine protease